VDVADWLSVRLILQARHKHAECWEGAGAGRASEQSLGARFFVNCSGAAACRLLLSVDVRLVIALAAARE